MLSCLLLKISLEEASKVESDLTAGNNFEVGSTAKQDGYNGEGYDI